MESEMKGSECECVRAHRAALCDSCGRISPPLTADNKIIYQTWGRTTALADGKKAGGHGGNRWRLGVLCFLRFSQSDACRSHFVQRWRKWVERNLQNPLTICPKNNFPDPEIKVSKRQTSFMWCVHSKREKRLDWMVKIQFAQPKRKVISEMNL